MKNKKIVTAIIFIIIVVAAIFGTYRLVNSQTHDKLVDSADKYMKLEEYDKAIGLFEEALKYKKDDRVKRDIILANELKGNKKIYDRGIFLMEKETYLDAIGEFKKIPNEDKNTYKKAQSKIQEAKEKYIQLNIQKAQECSKSKDYIEANKYLDKILKLDGKNEKANELKNEYIKKSVELKNKQNSKENKQAGKEDIKKEETKKRSVSLKNALNPDKACNVVAKLLGNKENNTVYEYVKPDVIDGEMYYIIHAYSSMKTHTATIGWYYVNKDTGEVYEWDLVTDEYTLLK